MSNTARLALPLIAASQAQKEVTHNEALTRLDALAHLTFLDRDLSAPPGSPANGDTYLVASGASGAWAGEDGKIAHYADGFWTLHTPVLGLLAYVTDEGTLSVFTATGWQDYGALLSSVATLSKSPSGAQSRFATVEEELALSGASVASSIVIPDRAIVFGVSTRTTTAITGATSYDCGITGEPSKFGGALGIAQGSTNAGVIGPQAFYADTPVVVTANGGSFTSGAVRVVLHYFLPVVPVS